MPARLAAVPDHPRRVVALIRVSKEGKRGERLMSPELQRVAIMDHCTRQGHEIVDEIEAIDESGSRAKSAWWPRLDSVIERVEAGEIDGVVMWKYSRVARNRRRWAVAVDRIESIGGIIESATEQVDASTSPGRLTRGMLAELNAFQAEQIGESWRETHAARVARGLPPGGKLPWGWEWGIGEIHPDPEKAPYIVEAYARFLAGAGQRELTRWLNESGVRPMHSARWHFNSVAQCLDSPVHAGFIVYQGERREGAHEGLVSVETYEAYLAERERRAHERHPTRRYLGSGIATCDCGAPMHGFTGAAVPSTGRKWVGYRCKTLGKGAGHGKAWSITAAVVDDALMAFLHEVADDVENRAVKKAASADVSRIETERIARELVELDKQEARLTEQLTRGIVPERAYVADMGRIASARADLEKGLATTRRTAAVIPEDASGLARAALEDWVTLSVQGRREVVRRLVREAAVDYATRTVDVVPVWAPQRTT